MAQPPPNTALLLIDIQDGFKHPTFWGPSRSNPSFETNVSSLLTTYRSLVSSFPSQHKIIHIAHSSKYSPLQPDQTGFQFQPFAIPFGNELVMVKSVNSAFIGTDLEAMLRMHFGGKPGKLWVVGLSTDHCVSTSVRMAQNLGVCNAEGEDGEGELVLIADATAAFEKGGIDAELVHRVHVESLKGEFAEIAKTSDVLRSWENMLEAK